MGEWDRSPIDLLAQYGINKGFGTTRVGPDATGDVVSVDPNLDRPCLFSIAPLFQGLHPASRKKTMSISMRLLLYLCHHEAIAWTRLLDLLDYGWAGVIRESPHFIDIRPRHGLLS